MRVVTTISVLFTLLLGLCAFALAADSPITLQTHGYMQNRLYFGSGSNPEFRTERVSISEIANFPNNSVGYVEVYYHPWAPSSPVYLESAYYDTPIDSSRLRIGKGRSLTFGMTPAYPNRKTSNYGIVAESFTQDRITGAQYFYQKGVLDLGASLQTGYRLGTRNIGDISGDTARNTITSHVVPHLAFRDPSNNFDLSRQMAFTTRIGGKWKNGLKAGLSAYISEIDGRDLALLTTSSTSNSLTPKGSTPLLPVGTTEKKMNVFGVDASYNLPHGFVAQGEFYDAEVSDLKYNAWDVLGGYISPSSGWKFFVRYSQQNMDTPRTDNPLSWDTTQTTFSVVQPISKTMWMQYEYELNGENPPAGIDKIDNDLFFAELFVAF